MFFLYLQQFKTACMFLIFGMFIKKKYFFYIKNKTILISFYYFTEIPTIMTRLTSALTI